MPSQQDPSGDPDVTALLNMDYIGVVHRLDRPVGGVMVYAKTKQAKIFLSKGISRGGFHKEYLAIVSGKPDKVNDKVSDYLKKEAGKSLSRVVDKNTSGAKLAILEYTVLDSVLQDTGEILTYNGLIDRNGYKKYYNYQKDIMLTRHLKEEINELFVQNRLSDKGKLMLE